MPEFNPFDIDFDGHVEGTDFLGFDYLVRRVLQPNRDEEAAHDWDDDEEVADDEFEDEDDY